jgi:hypothetical protein
MEATLPGPLRFAWMFYCQPISLHRRLVACGLEPAREGATPRGLLGGSPLRGRYLGLLLAPLILPLLALDTFALALAQAAGYDVDVRKVVFGAFFGMCWGLLVGIALGVGFAVAQPPRLLSQVLSFAVALGFAGGVQYGLAFGIEGTQVPAALAGGLAFGLAGGAAWCAGGKVAGGAGFSLGLGIALGFQFGWPGAFIGALSAIRLPLYLIEIPLQLALRPFWLRGSLRLAPVLWHELSYFPHPGLQGHIIDTAALDRPLAERALQAAAIAPGQRRAAERARRVLAAAA